MTALTNATRPTMTTSIIQTNKASTWLLANRDRLSLDKATTYLVSRIRTRTPLGASEFLAGVTASIFGEIEQGRDAFVARVKLAVTKMDLYRDLFPREFNASQAPAYSVQREREFYTLVDRRLFPIERPLQGEWDFYPFIPVSGNQQHNWIEGCCPFESIQTVFKLALVLSDRKPNGWKLLGLEKPPAAPLDAPAWTLFCYSCAVEPSPLRYLIHAFNLTCYRTGCIWLDIPNTRANKATFGYAWSAFNVAKLAVERLRADRINAQVLELNKWLVEDPGPRIARALELWDAAAAETARPDGRRVYVGPDGRMVTV